MLPQTTLALFGLPGNSEWIVIAILALLIFGKRLPDVARSMGRSIIEFKKGLKGVKDDIDRSADEDATATLPPKNNSKTDQGAS